tara:strand:+ start:6245 stop:7003 length:759 start_codon:yes stop_codon:yes gene_type:complete
MFKRIQFIELQDLAALPHIIRDGVTSYLEFLLRVFKIYDPVHLSIKEVLKDRPINRIIDLCSGGGGPSLNMANYFKDTPILLTDLYPNLSAFKKAAQISNIDYINFSVNALDYKFQKGDLLTLYTAFHHFNDGDAKKLIQNAVASQSSICISEFVQRDLKSIALVLPSPIGMLFLMPLVRPFQLSRLFFTYIIPLIPFVTLWDILVTVLRIRTKSELMEMVKDIDHYEWHYIERRTSLFLKVTSFIGVPKNA